jgi:hypothetical protein
MLFRNVMEIGYIIISSSSSIIKSGFSPSQIKLWNPYVSKDGSLSVFK